MRARKLKISKYIRNLFPKQSTDRLILLLRYLLLPALALLSFATILIILVYVAEIRLIYSIFVGLGVSCIVVILASIALLYPSDLWSFVKKNHYAVLAAALCIWFVVAGIMFLNGGIKPSINRGTTITYDEVSHIADGFFYQKTGTYFLNPEHPPLVKDIAAIPYDAIGAKPAQPLPKNILIQDYAQWQWGKTFLFESGNNTDKIIFFGRLSVLTANAILVFLLFLSLAKAWSPRAGLIAVFLITFSQFTIAHGSLVTFDVMSALLTVLALVNLSLYLSKLRQDKPANKELVLTALYLAGALTSKLSTVLLIPALLAIVILYAILIRHDLKGRWRKHTLSIVCLLALSFLLVSVFYAWHTRNMSATDIVAQIQTSYTDKLPAFGLTLLTGLADLGPLGRGVAEFAYGLVKTATRVQNGTFGLYFMGNFYGETSAGPLYFPVLYLTKLQLTYHILSVVAALGTIWIAIKHRLNLRKILSATKTRPLVAILGFYTIAFGYMAITSSLQIGLRHIFPVIFCCVILVSLALDAIINEGLMSVKFRRLYLWVVGAIVFAMSFSIVVDFPNFISSYNVLGGNTAGGYKVATDSNYDWGQDLKLLSAWKKEKGIDTIYFDIFVNPFIPISTYLGSESKPYDIAADPPLPSGSYLAVSVHEYQINTHRPLPLEKTYKQLDDYRVDRVRKTIFIYQIP